MSFILLAIYQIGLEKTKGSWRWTRNNTLVFDQSLWHASEPNGQNSSPPELCGGFCKCGGKPGIFDVPCNTPYRFICEYWTSVHYQFMFMKVTLFEKNSSIIFYVVYTDEIKRTIFIFRRYFSTNIWLLPVKLSFTYIKLYNYIIRIILTFTPCFLLYCLQYSMKVFLESYDKNLSDWKNQCQ